MNVDWYSPVFGHHNGYGNSAEQMIRALDRRGVCVGILDQSTMTFSGPCDKRWIRSHPPRASRAAIYFTLPTTWLARYPVSVGFSMNETTELPQDWVPHLGGVAEIWVPSSFCAAVFARYTDRPIHIVPLGVDPTIFRPNPRPRGEHVTFLHFAATHHAANKGAELAVEAFLKAFPEEGNARLVVQASVGTRPVSDDPRIVYTNDAIPRERMAEYFARFDALLYTSKGEGFGLIPLEAAATGLPVFHSSKTGMADYATIGETIPSHEVPAEGQRGSWYRVDTDALARSIREFVASPDAIVARALQQADIVRDRFTWDRSAEVIEQRLRMLQTPR